MANIDLIQRRVFLCAGHGGGDPGAVGQGTTEAAEVIDIVNRTADFLRKDAQVEVIHVPNELGFQQAISWLNARYTNIDSGVFVDVHKNSTVNAHGVETWYADDPDSREIALRVQSGLVQFSGLRDRGVKPDTSNRFGRLGSLRDTNTWAVLPELGFVSDGGDPVGPSANQKYAEALSKGLLRIWNLAPKPAPVPTQPQPPVPAPVSWTYKVVSTETGKQLGVYNKKENAWAKYQFVDGAARIQDTSGHDLTPAFVLEFNPPKPDEPEPQHPTDKDLEQDTRLNKIETFIEALRNFFTKG